MGGAKSTQAVRGNTSPFLQRHSVIKSGCFPWVIVLGLLVGIAGVWSSNKEVLGLFHDDGIYAVVAKSLSNGAGIGSLVCRLLPIKPNTRFSIPIFFLGCGALTQSFLITLGF